MSNLEQSDGEEVELAFEWRGLELVGSLSLPASTGPHPTMLLLQGSGPTDRTSDGFFSPISQAFVDRGIATYAFDKPGCGESSGNWRVHGLEDRADQAMVALDVLRLHRAVDSDRVGVFGHSQGGWLAQMLAADVEGLSAVVANSGPTIGVAEQNLFGVENTVRGQGFSEADVGDAVTFVEAVHQAAEDGTDYATVDETLFRAARQQDWYGYVTSDGPEDWAEICLWATQRFVPMDSLRRIRCPFLAVYGALDPLVPAWRGARDTGEAMAEAQNFDAAVVVVPTGNHRIQHGDPAGFVPGYLELMSDWVARRLARTPW